MSKEPPSRFDVRCFGAKGDGSHDDGPAINDALETYGGAFLPDEPLELKPFDIRRFGAKCDWRHDDGPAIKAATEAAKAAGGGKIYLPPGTFAGPPWLAPKQSLWKRLARLVFGGKRRC